MLKILLVGFFICVILISLDNSFSDRLGVIESELILARQTVEIQKLQYKAEDLWFRYNSMKTLVIEMRRKRK